MAAAKSMGLLATTHSWRVLIDAVEDTGLPSEVEATVTKVASDEVSEPWNDSLFLSFSVVSPS